MAGVRRALVAVVLVATLAGCGSPPRPAPVPTREPQPAGAAGGSCQLLDYEEITQDIGLSFDIAAASQVGQTYTCVVEREGAPLPDLTLSITLVQNLDIPTFKSKLVPSGATMLGDLGKVGYTRNIPAATGAGPAVEISWLAGNQRLITLRCRLAGDAPAEVSGALPGKLLTLAHRIDLTSI
jgi:hypothetical protein